jgi:hypothetical protein
MRSLVLTCIISLAVLLISAQASDVIQVNDVLGKPHAPLAQKDKKATVLIFITNDCPIANAYAPEIVRICDEYEKSAAFYLIHVDPDLKADDAKKHAAEFGYKCPVLIDKNHKLVKHAQATITPEAFVYAADGSLKYRGRIDDQYKDIGKKRINVTQRDLRDAVDAVLNGKEVKNSKTDAVGCFIPSLEGEQK